MYMIISSSDLLRMRNVSDRSSKENHNTHFMFNNHAVYERMWNNTVQPERPQMPL